MAWQDRPYYRDRSSSPTNPLMWLLTGSAPLFTAFGIRVRIHASMILLILMELVFAQSRTGLGIQNVMVSMTILFGSVLLHEFGHCFGARWMGGDADEILMWPLGGLAMANPPQRPWPSLVTTAMGPAVNLAICLVTGTVLAIMNRSAAALPWFPLRYGLRSYVPHDVSTYYIWWVFIVNYGLFMFNMLMVFYPFDGGRIVQELLWFKWGYYKSMMFATAVGMVGAVFVAAFGVAIWSLTFILIAGFGFFTCFRQRAQLKEMGPEEWQDSTDYSAAYEQPAVPRRRRKINRRAVRKARKRAQIAAMEQERIDMILAKVSATGLASLTWRERRALHKATEQQRKRDLEAMPEK